MDKFYENHMPHTVCTGTSNNTYYVWEKQLLLNKNQR